MKVVVTLLGCLLVLSGCASKKADVYRMQLVGLSAKDVLQCAGAPANSFDHKALTVFTYSLSTPQGLGVGSGQKICEASVMLEDSVVTHVSYRAPYGSEYCEPIFRSCPTGMGLAGLTG